MNWLAVTDWNGETVHQIVVNLAETMGLNLGKVAQPLRVAVCGSAVHQPLTSLYHYLGKKKPFLE